MVKTCVLNAQNVCYHVFITFFFKTENTALVIWYEYVFIEISVIFFDKNNVFLFKYKF